MRAKGIMSLRISKAPWENGSKMGIRRDTDSRLKAEMDATLPVEKNADWRRVRKKREVRASERVRERKGEDESEVGMAGIVCPFVADLVVEDGVAET